MQTKERMRLLKAILICMLFFGAIYFVGTLVLSWGESKTAQADLSGIENRHLESGKVLEPTAVIAPRPIRWS